MEAAARVLRELWNNVLPGRFGSDKESKPPAKGEIIF